MPKFTLIKLGLALFGLLTSSNAESMKNILEMSRRATVEITSESGNSKGTGFLIGRRHAVTCFHVVASIANDGKQINWAIFQDLKIKLTNGATISGVVVSIPSSQSPEPLVQDFAIIELSTNVPEEFASARLSVIKPKFEIGDDVIFSGYPLATPAMVSHRGMISGYAEAIKVICIQAPINKGNSGGALCNEKGQVIGIVSNREGGISFGLAQLNTYIEHTSSQGSVAIMGVDPLQAIKAISQTLDQYISTGIGYARATDSLNEYLVTRPSLLD